MSASGWKQWKDPQSGATHMKVMLTDDDARRMDSAQLAMLEDAAKLIELAFAEDTPQALTDLRAELRAEKGDGPRRLADLSPDELRDFLQRMRGVRMSHDDLICAHEVRLVREGGEAVSCGNCGAPLEVTAEDLARLAAAPPCPPDAPYAERKP